MFSYSSPTLRNLPSFQLWHKGDPSALYICLSSCLSGCLSSCLSHGIFAMTESRGIPYKLMLAATQSKTVEWVTKKRISSPSGIQKRIAATSRPPKIIRIASAIQRRRAFPKFSRVINLAVGVVIPASRGLADLLLAVNTPYGPTNQCDPHLQASRKQ